MNYQINLGSLNQRMKAYGDNWCPEVDKRILNLGCGNSTYGTDRIDLYKTEATTVIGDLNKELPFENETFDEVYCNCVLEHVLNLKTFIDEIYRVMKTNGVLFIRTDYAGYLPIYLFKTHEHNRILDIQYKDNFGYGHSKGQDAHYHLFVESHLDKMFRKFRNREYKYIASGRNIIIHMVLKMLPKKLGCNHIELRCMK